MGEGEKEEFLNSILCWGAEQLAVLVMQLVEGLSHSRPQPVRRQPVSLTHKLTMHTHTHSYTPISHIQSACWRAEEPPLYLEHA